MPLSKLSRALGRLGDAFDRTVPRSDRLVM